MHQPTPRPEQGCRITVCRGCCCGTVKKHPTVDHEKQVTALMRALPGCVRVVTECLGPCEESNVIVVQPSRPGRTEGGRPTWLGQVLDDDCLDGILHWITTGGPGLAAIPPSLLPRHIPRPRR